MTIENIDVSFITEPITAMDVAGFRLFLRHNIYNSSDSNHVPIITHIASDLSNIIGEIESFNGNNTIIFTSNVNMSIDEFTARIIDSVRTYLYYKCSDKILYEINYSPKLSQHEKNAYKKILFEMSRSRMYFDLLLNISYALPTVAVML